MSDSTGEWPAVRPCHSGLVDLHLDLPMFLYNQRADLLATRFLPEFQSGGVGIVVACMYLEDRYVPAQALSVALAQIARLYPEVEHCAAFAICRSFPEIERAPAAGKIALIIGMKASSRSAMISICCARFMNWASALWASPTRGAMLPQPALLFSRAARRGMA